VKAMKRAFNVSNKAKESGKIDFQPRLRKASKKERIEIAKQMASTIEKSDDEFSYIDTANLEDMPKEERAWIARKIVSSIPHDWGCGGC